MLPVIYAPLRKVCSFASTRVCVSSSQYASDDLPQVTHLSFAWICQSPLFSFYYYASSSLWGWRVKCRFQVFIQVCFSNMLKIWILDSWTGSPAIVMPRLINSGLQNVKIIPHSLFLCKKLSTFSGNPFCLRITFSPLHTEGWLFKNMTSINTGIVLPRGENIR